MALFQSRLLSVLVFTALSLLFAFRSSFAFEPTPSVSEDEFISLNDEVTPKVAYALKTVGERIWLILDIGTFSDGKVAVVAGLSSKRKVNFSADSSQAVRIGEKSRFAFAVNKKDLTDTPAALNQVRLGFAVRWLGGANGEDRLRWRFNHNDHLAAFQPMSASPADWQLVDLSSYRQSIALKQNKLNVVFQQPLDGKATVVIEDSSGKRIRNLLSGKTMNKGLQAILWDGCDDSGNPVKPGAYNWRSLHHSGIQPEFVMTFCNWDNSGVSARASNHDCFIGATANSSRVFFIAPGTEGGYGMISVGPDGKWLQGYKPAAAFSLTKRAAAASERYFFVLNDGVAARGSIDKTNPNWKAAVKLTLTRYDIASAKAVGYGGSEKYATLANYEAGPGCSNPELQDGSSLTGVAYCNGKLYVGTGLTQSILVIDPETGKTIKEIPFKKPSALAAAGNRLIGISANQVYDIDPEQGKCRQLALVGVNTPGALALDLAGNIYVVDGSIIKQFNNKGLLLKSFGTPGGSYSGPYDPERMIAPSGIAIFANKLWLAEARDNPKRITAWDLRSGKVVMQKFGNPPYGGRGCGFDESNAACWLGLNSSWNVNLQNHSADCRSVLGSYPFPLRLHFVRQDGRDFVVAPNRANFIYQLQANGALKPAVCYGTVRGLGKIYNWQVPETFFTAFSQRFPAAVNTAYSRKKILGKSRAGLLWVDQNGDGAMQPAEFEFTSPSIRFAEGLWANDISDLTIRVPAFVNNRSLMVTMKASGFYPGGAPRYPALEQACRSGLPIQYPDGTLLEKPIDSIVDRFGNLFCLTEPNLSAFSPQGTLLWTFPNRWAGVQNSHQAPLPESGVLQGALFYFGTAPLDKHSDVLALMGNFGRVFLISSDGLYIDEMFRDMRLGFNNADPAGLGCEPFGGTFGKEQGAQGRYYLQAGPGGFRIYQINGLDKVTRQSGKIIVRDQNARLAEAMPTEAEIAPEHEAALWPVIAGRNDQIRQSAAWSKSGKFLAKVRAGYDDKFLYLNYEVEDSSPWINRGDDWSLLFKSGDAVDFQFGIEPSSVVDRALPLPGDLRLLIAPYHQGNAVVLYKYKVPGTKAPRVYSSPWRSVDVDVVKLLDQATVNTKLQKNGYEVDARIPLADLNFAPSAGKKYRGDFGVIFGDSQGDVDILRSYWSNQNTGLVNDVPGEVMIEPKYWGGLYCREEAK
ncbi:MAG: hypothetical protein K2W82_00155 [Candidatus Obscuribacterales bacterium]|nr:hypothetical protein [Candidatus Obscuribacterales bacterium]